VRSRDFLLPSKYGGYAGVRLQFFYSPNSLDDNAYVAAILPAESVVPENNLIDLMHMSEALLLPKQA
jgi:hypothetical protein